MKNAALPTAISAIGQCNIAQQLMKAREFLLKEHEDTDALHEILSILLLN